MKVSRGSRAASARSTVSPPMPESKTPIGRELDKLDDPEFLEIEIEESSVDRGQLVEIDETYILVNLVNGLGQEPEFDDRTQLLDETRVRCTAVGRQRRGDPGDLAYRQRQNRIERPRLGQEGIARRLERKLELEPARLQEFRRRLPNLRFQRVGRVAGRFTRDVTRPRP